MNRKFHLSDILSVTTGRLVSTRRMKGIYDILDYMTGKSLTTYSLPQAADECRPILLSLYPRLAEISVENLNPDNWKEWVEEKVKKYGEFLEVTPIAPEKDQ